MSEAARPIEVHWFLPTTGDGRSVVDFFPDPSGKLPASARTADIGYLRQIAQAADRLGFEGVLTPTGTRARTRGWSRRRWRRRRSSCGSSWRSGRGSILPTLAAQQTATLQRISGGRALINIVAGGDAAEQRATATSWITTSGTSARGRVRDDAAEVLVGLSVRLRGQALQGREGRAGPPVGRGDDAAVGDAADLLRWRVAGGGGDRGEARRRVPVVGRAAGLGRGARRADAGAGGGAGADAALRDPAARDRAGAGGGGVGGGGAAAARHEPGAGGEGAAPVRADGVGGAAADERS